jgi:DivIVA domain-containing protein
VSLSLDDLRHPDLRSRLRGYDRDDVDRLLAMVVVAVERLERRRQRDTAALEDLSKELATARGRAEDAERRAAELAAELEVSRWAESAATERAGEWERRATEATERAERAEAAGTAGTAGPEAEAPVLRLPVAQRAARAVLNEARAQAAAIVRRAEEEAATLAGDRPGDQGGGEASGPTGAGGSGSGYDSRSGSSATIQS